MRCAAAMFVILLASLASAQEVTVQKQADKQEYTAGEQVKLSIAISIPYEKPLNVRLKDKNVLGKNGFDIQCYEAAVKPPTSVIQYQAIVPYGAGEYTLDPAEVTYTDPSDGKEKTAKSNSLTVKVKPSPTPLGSQQEGITTIYQCGGTQMQTTSYSSSGGSVNINMGGGSFGFSQSFGGGLDDMMNMLGGGSMEDRLNQMQQNMQQDTQALKQQMMQAQAQRNETENAFRRNVESSQQVQDMRGQLASRGYNETGGLMSPQTNDTGTFQYNFQKGNDTESIKGSMTGGNVSELGKWGTEDGRNAQAALENSTAFKDADRKLAQQGYKPQEKAVMPSAGNQTAFNYQYRADDGRTANLTGQIRQNGTVSQLEEESSDGNADITTIIAYIIGFLLLAAIIAYLALKALRKKPAEAAAPSPVAEPIDYGGEARKMLQEAQEMFSAGKRSDAYARVSYALRFYFAGTMDFDSDRTDQELAAFLDTVKSPKSKDARECLILCGMVKFARYEPNEKDFSKILKYAINVIDTNDG